MELENKTDSYDKYKDKLANICIEFQSEYSQIGFVMTAEEGCTLTVKDFIDIYMGENPYDEGIFNIYMRTTEEYSGFTSQRNDKVRFCRGALIDKEIDSDFLNQIPQKIIATSAPHNYNDMVFDIFILNER